MKIRMELVAGNGPNYRDPTKKDMDNNIKAVDNAIYFTEKGLDIDRLIDVKSILMGIRKQLPNN